MFAPALTGCGERSHLLSSTVKANGMKRVEIKTGHDALITAPELLVDLLDTLDA